jgi:hypothetical protein
MRWEATMWWEARMRWEATMRERRSSDWVIDLQGRHGIEAQVEAALEAHPVLTLLRSSTASFDRLDFQLLGPGERLVELEVKAKHQPLSGGWRDLRSDVAPADLFVLDELALRKIVDAGRYAFLLVRDIPLARWVLWSAGDLLVASRVRHTRRIEKGATPMSKGKLVFDLSEGGFTSTHLGEALDAVSDTVTRVEALWSDISPWPAVGAGR